MKYGSIVIIALLLIIFTAASVSAGDVDSDEFVSAENDIEVASTDTITPSEDIKLSSTDDDEVVSANPGNYSGLAGEISSGGNVKLQHDYYTYDSGSTITITDDDRVIDGNGAVIDMDGSSIRAFTVSASGVIIKNLTIKNVNFDDNGGAIYFSGSGTVENCNFTNNKATGYYSCGGAVFFQEIGNVTNCNFTNNKATGYYSCGGAVFFQEIGNVTNCNFTNNKATGDDSCGGAIYMYSGSIENCNFTGNTAEMGNAIYINNHCTISDCDFTNNPITKGAIHSVTGDIALSNNILNFDDVVSGKNFTEIQKSIDDANERDEITIDGLYTGFGMPIRITKSLTLIGQNNATLDAKKLSKILYITVNNVIIKNIQFTNGYAENGGAIYFNSSGTVTNCNFTGNNATWYGGAVYFNSSGTVTNCNFTDNTASVGGGAVYFLWEGTVTNCNFTNNNAQSGGAIFIYSGRVTDCNFSNNTGKFGGAVYFYETGNVTDCNFTNNKATGYYSCGGAVFFQEIGNVTNCNFTNNQAELGGAVYFNDECSITNCNFTGNSDPEVYPIPKKQTPIIITAADIIVGNDAIITVSLPGDINGVMNITIGGVNRSADIKNGTATVQIAGLAIGDYNVVAWFGGNENYLPNTNSTMFNVSPKPKDNLTVTTQKNTDEGYISVTVPADITKNLTLTIDGKTYTINPGSNKIDLTGLGTGDYAYSITYAGDDKYNSYSSSDSIHLTKTAPKLNIIANDTTYGQEGKITVSLSQNITGSVNFTLLDNESVIDTKTSAVINGTATYLIPALNVGRYTLKAQSAGDSKHYKSDLYSASFKVAPKISITPDVVIGDDGIITMELGDVAGVIAVSVDGELDGSKKIAGGKFIYALSTWVLLVGNHTLTFEYTGTSFDENVFNYWDNETSSYKPIEYRFHIAPKQTETKSDSDNDNLFEIILEDEKGTVLSNATGQIEVEIVNQFTQEVQHLVVNVINGIATLDISKFKDGNYLIRWNYLGDGKHTPISKELTLTIAHKPSKIIASDLTVLYTSTATYYVTVYTGGGEAISGAQVTFLINNRAVKTVTTDSRGVAAISISQNPGSYRITAKADSISITKTLTVTHLLALKTVKVKKSAKKLVLTASLKKVGGKYLKGKKITFKFNGKKYTAKTNKKGVAKLIIKSKVLKKLKAGKKITYQATYLKDSVKKKVKVKK